MRPEDSTRALHAYVDGELDAAAALELEAQMAANPSLRASYERLRDMSGAIRANATYYRAPGRFRQPSERTRPNRWLMLAPAFAVIAVLAFALGFFAGRPARDDALAAEAVDAHVRATLSGRLIEVASSDQHTVKPWLSARLPFSPPVADLSSAGYPLAGARLDYVGGERVAALVYQRRKHVIDVYVARGIDSSARTLSREGFNVEHFAAGGLRYWIVSDLNRNELADFVRLYSAAENILRQ